MSLGNDLLQMGYEAQSPVYGESFSMLKSGTGFVGILEPVQSVDPDMPLGADMRELSVLHCPTANLPAELTDPSASANQRIAQGDFIWETVKREDNPADFSTKIWVVKVTANDA